MNKTHLKNSIPAILVALSPSPLWAQKAAPAQTASIPADQAERGSAASPSGQQQLEEIIVTAQRRTESLQSVAVPVDVVSGAALSSSGITDPSRLGNLVPSISITPSAGGVRFFFLRGVGNFTATTFSDPSVAVNYDGIYLGRPTATSGLFYDLERIEVLMGPQGTLYGRNATGGVVNVIPARPVAGKWAGYANATYENYDAKTLEGAINAPLGKDGALRISGALVDRDGYQSDGTYDEKRESLRVQMGAALTPNLNVRVAGDYVHLGGSGLGPNYDTAYAFNPFTGQYIARPSGLGSNVGLYDPRAQAYKTTLPAGPAGRNLGPLTPAPFQNNNAFGANAQIDWNTGIGTVTVIPAWRYNNIDSRSIGAGYTVDLAEKDEQFSLEARLAGKRIGIFDYSIGGLYYTETQHARYAIDLQPIGVYQTFSAKTDSYAAFGRLTANLGESFRLVGGLRYTHDRKSFAGDSDNLTVVCTVAVAGVPTCPTAPLIPFARSLDQVALPIPPRNGIVPLGASGAILARSGLSVDTRQSASRVTYRGAVEFDVAPRSLLYASIEDGFRSGGFSFAAGYENFGPEYITAYTIGSKNRFFDNRLQLNLEVFLWKQRDQQLTHFGLDLAGQQGSFTENIGRSTSKGVDLDARLLATPTINLAVKVQYLDAKYNDFVYRAPNGFAPVLTGCPQAVDPANPGLRIVNCSGFSAYNAPKFTVNLAADKTIDVGSYKIVLGADTQYRSSRYVGFEYLAAQKVGATWQSNARVSFGPQDGRWEIEGFVRNIENERYALNKFLDTVSNALLTSTAAPRTYGVRLHGKF